MYANKKEVEQEIRSEEEEAYANAGNKVVATETTTRKNTKNLELKANTT